MDKTKILIFHPALAPYRVDFLNSLGELTSLTVVFLRRDLFSQSFESERLLLNAKFAYQFLTRGFDIRQRCFRLGLRRVIREVQPDVVISYEASLTTLILCLMRRFVRWQLWTMMDDSPDLVKSRKGLRAFIRNWVVRRCNGIIVPSSMAAEAYPCYGNFIAVPIIYDEKRLRKDEATVFLTAAEWRKRNLMPDDIMMLFVGRLSPEKNLRWLIEMASDRRWPQKLRLFLVGSGVQESVIQAQIKAVDVEGRVVMLGRKIGEELHSLYASTDLFVLPSVSETFGAVVSEALHWGAKCLVSESVGAKALIADENGWVFRTSDDDHFFNALNKAVESLTAWNGIRKSKMKISLCSCIENLVREFEKSP